MDGTGDYLKKRAQELDLGRGEALEAIQAHLDGIYPGQVRALSLKDGILRLTTVSAAVASELRLRQVELLTAIRPLSANKIERLAISIRG